MEKEDREYFYAWIGFVEETIGMHSFKKAVIGKRPGKTLKTWVYQVINEVDYTIMKNDNRKSDGNLDNALILGACFLFWWHRCCLAKTSDPRRKKADRINLL